MAVIRSPKLELVVALSIGIVCVASTAVSAEPRSFRVEVNGEGRPMILIPGLASAGETWDTTVARYRGRFRCHVLTLAGFAGVPPIEGPLIATVKNDLAGYIRSERLERPVIVGHSLGGTLALALASEYPDLVGPLVIVDTLPFMAATRFQARTVDEAEPAIAASHASLSKMTRAQYDEYVRSGAATDFMISSPADHEKIKQWSLASDPRTVADALAEFYRLDQRESVARIQAPTLVLGSWIGVRGLVAKYSVDLPRASFVRAFTDQFAQLRPLHFALSDTARHFIMLDDPGWFFEQLDHFLADPDAAVRDRGLRAN